jgi:hypothetical protein
VIAELEPNPYNNPQAIPAACGSFMIPAATMPLGDADYFKVSLASGASVDVSTFYGTPGKCDASADTVLSLWKGSVPSAAGESGGCSGATGHLVCNDTDSPNTPCSRIAYTVPAGQGGEHVVKVHNWYTTKGIPSYGLLFMLQ